MEVKTYQQEQLALYLLGCLLDKFSGDNNMHSLKRYGLLQTNILFNNSALEPNWLICEELALAIMPMEAQL